MADPPLRSSHGLHQPYALRNVIELESEDASSASRRLTGASNRRRLRRFARSWAPARTG